jgi:amidase
MQCRTHPRSMGADVSYVGTGLRLVAACAVLASPSLRAAAPADVAGRWEVTTTYPGGSFVAGLDLAAGAAGYSGRSGYLVPDGYFYNYTGVMQKDALNLQVSEGKTVIGSLRLHVHSAQLSGTGVLHDVPVKISGRRPLPRPPAPMLHNFIPQVFYRSFSGANPPALRIFPGDTVRTQTVDANGGGENAAQRTLPGNPQTGPFYIEGAMIGDTIAVHFNKIRPNRDTAFQYRGGLDARALPAGYQQQRPAENWSSVWKIDREHGTATPENPSDKLRGFSVKLLPMLGCVGVAPYWNQAFGSARLGPFGGNLDYNQVREGTTLYLPVYQAGALLSMGDGHALQADGEITGQGLETSMDVEFTVDLIKDQLLDQPWAENDDYIMVSGIGGSLNDALAMATAGLSNWLNSYYQLDSAEIATVLAASIHYDIAEMVDPEFHVVAKITKQALQQIPKAAGPSTMFCQAAWGCADLH